MRQQSPGGRAACRQREGCLGRRSSLRSGGVGVAAEVDPDAVDAPVQADASRLVVRLQGPDIDSQVPEALCVRALELHAIDELDRAGHAVVAMTEELRQDISASISNVRDRASLGADGRKAGCRQAQGSRGFRVGSGDASSPGPIGADDT